MKNLILITGTLLIALNSLIVVFVSDYAVLNFLLADLSLVLSAGVINHVACSKMKDGFKIGLTVLLVFTGIIRVVCAVFLLAVAVACIFSLEIICVAGAWFASKK